MEIKSMVWSDQRDEKGDQMANELRPVCDLNHMAALELAKVYPRKTERIGTRFTGFYPKEKADKVISKYELGELKAPVIETMSALRRVKDRIFDAERAAMREAR